MLSAVTWWIAFPSWPPFEQPGRRVLLEQFRITNFLLNEYLQGSKIICLTFIHQKFPLLITNGCRPRLRVNVMHQFLPRRRYPLWKCRPHIIPVCIKAANVPSCAPVQRRQPIGQVHQVHAHSAFGCQQGTVDEGCSSYTSCWSGTRKRVWISSLLRKTLQHLLNFSTFWRRPYSRTLLN